MNAMTLDRLSDEQRAALAKITSLNDLTEAGAFPEADVKAALDACEAFASEAEGAMKGLSFQETMTLRPGAAAPEYAQEIFDIVLAQRLIAIDRRFRPPEGASYDPRSGTVILTRKITGEGFEKRFNDVDAGWGLDPDGPILRSGARVDAAEAFLVLAGKILHDAIEEAAEADASDDTGGPEDVAHWTKKSEIAETAALTGPDGERVIRWCANRGESVGEYADAHPEDRAAALAALFKIADHLEQGGLKERADKAAKIVQLNQEQLKQAKEAGDKRRAEWAAKAKEAAVEAIQKIAERVGGRDTLLKVRLAAGDATLPDDLRKTPRDADAVVALLRRIVAVMDRGDSLLDRRLIDIHPVMPARLRGMLQDIDAAAS